MEKWKTRRIWALVTAMVLLAAPSLSICGSKSYNTAAMAETMATAVYVMDTEEGQTDTAFLGESPNTLKAESGSGLFPSSDIGNPAGTGRKLVRSMNMSVKVRDFGSVFSQATDKVRELNGYVRSSDVPGISVNSYGGSQQRCAGIRARTPTDRPDRFVGTVESAGNVTSKQEQVTDVTLQYSDVQSRKKSTEIEQERLQALSEKMESLDAVMALEARLSEIRYELESYTSQLRFYDNQADHNTISINVGEIESLTPTVPDSTGIRIQKGFNRSPNNLGEAGTDLIVWITSNNPVLLVLVVVIAVTVLFIRGLSRRMQGRLHFLSRFSNPRGKHMGEKKGRRNRRTQAAEEQTEKAVEEQTENRRTLEKQTEKTQKERG